MNDFDDQQFGTALRDRLAHEHPDLEGLASAAFAAGSRARRRRRLVTSGSAAAAIAGIAALTVGLGGFAGDSEPIPDNTWAAGGPEAEAPATLHEGQIVDLTKALTGRITTDPTGLAPIGDSMAEGSGTGFYVVPQGRPAQISRWWSNGFHGTQEWPGISIALEQADAQALGVYGLTDKAPVTVPADWTCEWFLTDDKASCTSAEGDQAGLVIRPAKDRAAWLSSPDKGNDPSVYVTEAHGGIFISVQVQPGTPNSAAHELGEHLTWVD